MRHLKYFENIKDEPQVYDYALVNIDVSRSLLANRDKIMEFVNNTVGQISRIKKFGADKDEIMVVYDTVPTEISSWFIFRGYNGDQDPKYNGMYCRTFDADKIVAFDKDKEKLEQLIINKKFNL